MDFQFLNARGNAISLIDNPYFHLLNVDGHTTVSTNISSIVIGSIDGDEVNNIQAQPRSITLDLRIKNGVDVETAKRYVLGIVKIKQRGSIIWTQNQRTVKINGVVESIEMPRWENDVEIQITMHCEVPFWEDIDYVIQEISEALNLHYFTEYQNDMLYFPVGGIALGEFDMIRTRNLHNDGDVDVGLAIEILAFNTVTNPIIYNHEGKFFCIGHGSGSYMLQMNQGDIINISTVKGNKSVWLHSVESVLKKTFFDVADENNFAVYDVTKYYGYFITSGESEAVSHIMTDYGYSAADARTTLRKIATPLTLGAAYVFRNVEKNENIDAFDAVRYYGYLLGYGKSRAVSELATDYGYSAADAENVIDYIEETVLFVNLMSFILPKSTWLQLAAGDNTFAIDSDESTLTNMKFTLNYKQRYI